MLMLTQPDPAMASDLTRLSDLRVSSIVDFEATLLAMLAP